MEGKLKTSMSSVSTISSMENLQKTNFSSPFTTTLNTTLSIKLDCDNYFLWRSQVLHVVQGHRISGYLFGTNSCPPKFLDIQVTFGNHIQNLNPTYEWWNRENQLLLSWLLIFVNNNSWPSDSVYNFT